MNGIDIADARRKNLVEMLNRKNPDHIPTMAWSVNAALGYSNKKYWDVKDNPEAFQEAITCYYRDLPVDFNLTGCKFYFYDKIYELLRGCSQYRLHDDGVSVEYLEKSTMQDTDYDDLIADPTSFLKRVCLPRMYPFLFNGDPKQSAKIVEQAMEEFMSFPGAPLSKLSNIDDYVKETYGVTKICDPRFPFTTPGDIFLDNFRGFRGTLVDLRRHYDKMVEACQSLWDHNCCNHYDNTSIMPDGTIGCYPAHICTYLKPSQYNDLCYKFFRVQIDNLAKANVKLMVFMERHWLHLLDFVNDLPKDSLLMSIDDDNVEDVYKIVGDHQLYACGGKLVRLRNGSKEENIDIAKKTIDLLAPSKGFVFTTDKSWICNGDISPNLLEVYRFVDAYGKY